MTSREAFILGIARFCKEAGFDSDDAWQMTRLLLMSPVQASPIIKIAATKRAGWWDDTRQIFGNAWNYYTGGPTMSYSQYKDREAVNNMGVQMVDLQQQDQAAMRAQKAKGQAMVGDPAAVNKMHGLSQQVSDIGWKATDLGRAGAAPPKLTSLEDSKNVGKSPEQLRKDNLEAAMTQSMRNVGWTPEKITGSTTAFGNRGAMDDMVRQYERQLGVSNLLKVRPEALEGSPQAGMLPGLRDIQAYLKQQEAFSGRQTPKPTTGAMGSAQSAAGQITAARGGRTTPQTSSSPEPTGGPPPVAPGTQASAPGSPAGAAPPSPPPAMTGQPEAGPTQATAAAPQQQAAKAWSASGSFDGRGGFATGGGPLGRFSLFSDQLPKAAS